MIWRPIEYETEYGDITKKVTTPESKVKIAGRMTLIESVLGWEMFFSLHFCQPQTYTGKYQI